MVAELDQSSRVHQALHGCADGHRLLACSTSLKPRDQKTMFVMSDVSGASLASTLMVYLTGYGFRHHAPINGITPTALPSTACSCRKRSASVSTCT
jgi:hypothetical protein